MLLLPQLPSESQAVTKTPRILFAVLETGTARQPAPRGLAGQPGHSVQEELLGK